MNARFPAALLALMHGPWESARAALVDGLDSMGSAIQAAYGTFTTGLTLPGGVTIEPGKGSPQNVLVRPLASLYLDTVGGKLYVKESGPGTAAGWVAK